MNKESKNISPSNHALDVPIVTLKDVHKEYKLKSQSVHALRGVNLTIPRAAKWAITGKSGSGKSTLLHIIGTLDRPSSGEVKILDMPIHSMKDAALSKVRNRSIGFIFQMNNLLPEFSAIENVMMPGLIAGANHKRVLKRATKLMKAVELPHRLNHKPSEMSGGEQQRVAIARALIMSPAILLADEPTGNLDEKTSEEIQKLIFSIVESLKMTLLLVTHDMDLAGKFPKKLVMSGGRLETNEANNHE